LADENRFNLLHRPDLKPERNYRSEAIFPPPGPTPAVDINVPPEPELPQLIEDLKELEELCPGLPDGLEPVGEVVTVLRKRAEVIYAEQKLLEEIPPDRVVGPEPGSIVIPEDVIPKDISIGTNVFEDIPKIPGVPKMFPPPSHVKISVTTPKTLVQLAKDVYVKDQINLQKHYLQSLRLALQQYFQNQFAIMGELGISDMSALTREYHGSVVSGVSSNSQHLNDTIVRSQVARKQKAKYFSKLTNTDQTLVHLRNWNASEKLRERYYGEAYGDSEKFTDSEANAILRQNRSEYDANYKGNLYNMYKYLDGSMKMTEDILDHTILESKAKAKLIKDGVDVFAQPKREGGEGVETIQAKDSEDLKAKQKADEKQQQSTQKPTPEEVDKANKITDPADEKVWGLAPNGGHWSQNDIDYLIKEDPEIYGTTGDKLTNVKNTLGLDSKYAAPEEEKKDDKTDSNKSTESKTEKTATTSDEKVQSVTGEKKTEETAADTTTEVDNKDNSSGKSITISAPGTFGGRYSVTVPINEERINN